MEELIGRSKIIRKSFEFFSWIDQKVIKIFSHKNYLIIIDIDDMNFFFWKDKKKILY